MKVGIIAGHISDLYISTMLPVDIERVFILENRRGDLHTLDIYDAAALIVKHIDKLIEGGVDKIVLSPVFEIYFRYIHEGKRDYRDIILPLFEDTIKNHILPYSIVGKLCFIGNQKHTKYIVDIIGGWCKDFQLTDNQLRNSKFGPDWTFYRHDTVLLDTLFSIGSNWFVNKMIKVILKKIKDRSPDSMIFTNYGYYKFQKTILGFSHKKIRIATKNKIISTLQEHIKINSDNPKNDLFYHTGDIDRYLEKGYLYRLIGSKVGDIGVISIGS